MRKIEHIGIAVKSLEVSNILFEKLLGVPSYKTETVESKKLESPIAYIQTSPISDLYLFLVAHKDPQVWMIETPKRRVCDLKHILGAQREFAIIIVNS